MDGQPYVIRYINIPFILVFPLIASLWIQLVWEVLDCKIHILG